MQAFAALLDRLVLTPQRNAKLRLMVDYFRTTPDPDRGYALAALTSDLDIPSVKPAIPVFGTMPHGTAKPKAWVSRSRSPSVAPPCTRTVRS